MHVPVGPTEQAGAGGVTAVRTASIRKEMLRVLGGSGDTQQERNGYGPAALLQEGLPAPR